MGLLTKGLPLSWEEILPYVDYIKEHGIAQFLAIYNKAKHREDNLFRWGDEIEYTIVKFDHEAKKVRVCLRGDEILKQLQAQAEINDMMGTDNKTLWAPELCGYMIEGTPGHPYGALLACFNMVETNMIKRRKEVQKFLNDDEALMSMSFPALGTLDFTFPPTKIDMKNSFGRSMWFSDEVVHQGHPRYTNLLRNITQRRGEKISINVPIFKDEKTPWPFTEEFECPEAKKNAKENHIHLDHLGFGPGCCCLQITFQAINMEEASWLYDQLAPITPILVALSAATPIFRSYLADVDSRWDVISASADDRTAEERGIAPLKNSKFVLDTARYACLSCYIHETSQPYNDVEVVYEDKIYQKLIDEGVDEHVARHIAYMFVRDPIQVYKERLEQDDENSTEHFETIQSSVWNNMRFKPPPSDNPSIGWRVEFRPTEVQLTDFENAAYCCFVVLLTRVIISYNLVFVTNISTVNQNMEISQRRDAVLNEKLHFRNKLIRCEMTPEGKRKIPDKNEPCFETAEMSVNEIINGDGKEFPGLVPLIFQYVDEAEIDVNTRDTITQYLTFIQKRASGEISTLAHWMRDFVQGHPKYAKDSHVPDETVYDMIKTMNDITLGTKECPELLGDFKSKTERKVTSAVCRAEAAIVAAHEKSVVS